MYLEEESFLFFHASMFVSLDCHLVFLNLSLVNFVLSLAINFRFRFFLDQTCLAFDGSWSSSATNANETTFVLYVFYLCQISLTIFLSLHPIILLLFEISVHLCPLLLIVFIDDELNQVLNSCASPCDILIVKKTHQRQL